MENEFHSCDLLNTAFPIVKCQVAACESLDKITQQKSKGTAWIGCDPECRDRGISADLRDQSGVFQNTFCIKMNLFALFGQSDPGSRAVKKYYSQLIFQRFDDLTDMWL